jgi:NitT/TauT family transport system permease protein
MLIVLWQLLSMAIGKSIVFPKPAEVVSASLALYLRPEFLAALLSTFGRVLLSFALCVAAGSLSGFAAGLSPFVAASLSPVLTLIRATPVLAIILLALLWFPAGFVPVFSAFLMAYPVMHTSVAVGVGASDQKLIEMARLFCVPPGKLFFRLRLPSAAPHVLSGAKNALGLCWKVVVAGEVLSQPALAIGTGMQESRVYLETSGVFAWAAASIILCGLSEWFLGLAARKAGSHAL